jgi:hypothetical protein
VQKTISATLSTEFAEDTADFIDAKVSSKTKLSIYDDRHQNKIMMLGASGKLGIGVHSNWVVLNSLFQQMNENSKPQLYEGTTEEGTIIPFEMRLGNFNSQGKLGLTDISEVGPSLLSITTVNMINQNSSTDNQKLQIMGRRNENSHTINVFSLLNNLGVIDEKITIDGKTKTVGYADLFISQPIIRRYVELKSKMDSIIEGFNDNKEKEIQDILLEEFGQNVTWAIDEEGGEIKGVMAKKVFDKVSENLTSQTLYDNLVVSEGSYQNQNQWAVYQKFKTLDRHSQEVSKLQQLLNIEGQGLGVSYFDVISKKDNLLKNYQVLNADKLLGDVAYPQSAEEVSSLLKEGFVKITDSVYMRPTTVPNRKLINSTSLAYNLWKNVFPFENSVISEQVDMIIETSNVKQGTKKEQELRYAVVAAMKDFFYSYVPPNSLLFEESIDEERNKLFMDIDGNLPLAKYLLQLKAERHPLFREAFFRDLEFQTGFEGEESIIKYSLNEKSNFNKNETYKILEDLASDKRQIKKDVDYTYEDLIKDLTKYSLLASQENSAIGFRQYIPVSVLERYGVLDTLRRVAGVEKYESHSKIVNGYFRNLSKYLQEYDGSSFKVSLAKQAMFIKDVEQINKKYGADTIKIEFTEVDGNFVRGTISTDNTRYFNQSVFFRQFIQHNPEFAFSVNLKKESKNWTKSGTMLTSKEGIEKAYLKVREEGDYTLYEHLGGGVYQKINKLGSFGMNEYSPSDNNKQSVIKENQVEYVKPKGNFIPVAPVNVNNVVQTLEEQFTKNTILQIMSSISEKGKDSKFSEVAKILLPFIQNSKVNVINFNGLANAAYVSQDTKHPTLGLLKGGEIYISKELLERGNLEEIRYAFIEEVLHSITSDEINKYIDSENTNFDMYGNLSIAYQQGVTEEQVPTYISRLLTIYSQAGKSVINEVINPNKDQKFAQQQTDVYNKSVTVNNQTRINRILNIKEFIIGVTTDPIFREEMSKIEYNGKSILSKFAAAIKSMLKAVHKNLTGKSIAEEGFNAVIDMLEANKPAQPVVEIKQEPSLEETVEDLNFLMATDAFENPPEGIFDDAYFNTPPENLGFGEQVNGPELQPITREDIEKLPNKKCK